MNEITDIESVLQKIFSWVILTPISIIISGWLLARPISIVVATEQKFVLNLGVLKIQATGSQVILGFTGFIITTLLCGGLAGKEIYELVNNSFGINPGQFNSICMFSSFLTVAWSCLFFGIHYICTNTGSNFVDDKDKYEKQLNQLSEVKREGK